MAMIGRPSPPSRLSTGDIADNAITSAKIAADVLTAADVAPNAITASELADDAVDIAALSASGTADNTTFLRGDNSWQIVDTEGTGIKSTGESGGSKFLREDGDGTSSWQTAGSPSITDNGNATALTIGADEGLTINGSLQQLTNRNLTGTYSSHELFIADGYTLTGNITVNEDIVLTKLSDDGNTITLTTDGNSQTITGTGSIETSTLAQTPVTSLTGMTGELNSAVTFPTGHVLQVQGVMNGEVDTTTSTIPSDNTIPQNTEGKEAFTLAITPSNSNNKLLIHAFVGAISNNTNNRRGIIALFKDSVANALASSYADYQAAGTGEQGLDLTHFMTAGTTSEITFRIRFASDGSGTTTLNGSSGGRLHGGVLATGMTITEIQG